MIALTSCNDERIKALRNDEPNFLKEHQMRKADLIAPININRLDKGLSYEEVLEAAKPLYRKTIKELKAIWKEERS